VTSSTLSKQAFFSDYRSTCYPPDTACSINRYWRISNNEWRLRRSGFDGSILLSPRNAERARTLAAEYACEIMPNNQAAPLGAQPAKF